MDKKKEIEHWTTNRTMEYHRQQFIETKRSTVAFEKFVSENIDINGKILDLACGGGAVDAYIAELHQDVCFVGVDIIDKSFWMLDEFAEESIKNRITLEKGDWYNLDKKYSNVFDGIISVQALSWLEEWRTPLEKIIELNPKWIALSSLFYEGRIEFQVKALDYERNDEIGDHEETYYNVYSIPIIRDFFVQKGYNVFKYAPFEMDIDIPKPNHMDFATYTVKTENGNRLQISAGMLMPWYFIFAAKE